MSLFTEASRLERNNCAFALLHIVESRGSSPRHAASMLVPEQGATTGTIGGGMIERLAIEQARKAIKEGRSRLFHGKLARQGPDAVGSDCGGTMTVHIAVYASRPALFLLGAGHVNRALARFAVQLGFQVTLADPWQENIEHPDLPERCQRIGGESFTAILPTLDLTPQSFVIIATHNQDREVLEQVIGLPLRYLGLLASRRKAQHFREWLKKEKGSSEQQLKQLHAPVGLDLLAETPEEIAVSILAQLIPILRQHNVVKPEHCKTAGGKASTDLTAVELMSE